MPRGKHGRAAAKRRGAATTDRLDGLARDLLVAADRAAEARSQAAAVHEATERLHELERRRDAAVAEEFRRLRGVLDDLEEAVLTEEEFRDRIVEAWSEFSEMMLSSYGGRRLDALEHLLADTSLDRRRSTIRLGVHKPGLSPEGVRALQKARGLRSKSDEAPSGPKYESNPPTDWLIRQVQVHSRQRPIRNDRGLVGAWWIANAAEFNWDDELTGFGAVVPEDVADWLRAGPARAPYADEIANGTFATAGQVASTGRWPNPHVPAPLFSRPSDAAALRWWYWVMAETEEIGSDLAEDPDRVPTMGPFDTPPISSEGEMWREAANMLATATLFWLPPGQSASYLASRPLEVADRDDIRLPFQRALIVPAEPLVLDPLPGARLTDEETRKVVDAALDVRQAATRMSTTLADIETGRQLQLGCILRACGTRIEAVLLEADSSGRPGPRMLWCLAVPTPDGSAVFSRVVVPAWRERAVWGEPLDQLAAVAAWGDWVEPPLASVLPPPDRATHRGKPNAPTPPQWLRVLDVRRTEGHGTAEPTGRRVAPHVRRGHWRRQHFGPGGNQVKRVRISPTVVNAGRGPLAPAIYRLPSPPAPAVDGEAASKATNATEAAPSV